MKRYAVFIMLLIFLGTGSTAIASNISSALYYGTVRAMNSGNISANVSANVSINTPSWIATGTINSTATNVVIRDSSGSDTPFMPGYDSNPWIVWFDSVPGNGSIDATLYTNSSGGDIAYFPDSEGMTVNDDDTLELRDNFTVEIYACPNTDNASNKYLIHKDGAFDIYISPTTTETVIAEIPSVYPVIEAVNGGNNNSDGTNHTVNLPSGIEANDLLLVFFTADGTPTITFPNEGTDWLQLYETHDGNSEATTTACYRIADGNEGATITVATSASQKSAHTSYRISNYSGTPEISSSATGGSTGPNPGSLSPTWGEAKTLWFAVCGYDTGTTTVTSYPANYSEGRNDRSNAADGVGIGTARRENTAASENPPAFEISDSRDWVAYTVGVAPYILEEITLSATDTSNIPHKFTTTSNGSTISFLIDDVEKDSYEGTINVINNANDWTFATNDSVYYMDYAEIKVDGVQKGYWEWEYGATFSDQSGNGNTATPTFRTSCSDANVTASLISYSPVQQASCITDEAEDWPSMIEEAPDEPETAYTEEESPGIFFQPLVHTFWSLTDIPESFFWYNFAFIVIISAGMIAFYFFAEKKTNALLLKIIVMLAIMIFFSLPGPNIYGSYVALYFGFFSFGVLILSKDYGW